MQDLTPQLRTRLSRVERAVGVFVLLATLLLVGGFCYYLYHTADRKGWFKTKVAYATSLDSAAGLKVGDPVKLWGFDVGELTRIDTLPPDDLYNVYIELEIREPYFGYMCTEGSRIRVTPADFLGKRMVEVTKGTNYTPTHLAWSILELPPREAQVLDNLPAKLFLDTIPGKGTNPPLAIHLQPLSKEVLKRIAAAGVQTIRVVDRSAPTKGITAIWNPRTASYTNLTASTKAYWLEPEESPALTDRLQGLVANLEQALPGVLSLTNQLMATLSNAAALTAHADTLVQHADPIVTNAAVITAQLRDPNGSLGQWLLPANLHTQLLTTLTNANGTLTNATATLAAANTNMVGLVAQLNQPLQNLSLIISNLNAQVQVNTNLVSTVNTLLADIDDMIQGLKRHWLFRSAFKPAKPTKPKKP